MANDLNFGQNGRDVDNGRLTKGSGRRDLIYKKLTKRRKESSISLVRGETCVAITGRCYLIYSVGSFETKWVALDDVRKKLTI